MSNNNELAVKKDGALLDVETLKGQANVYAASSFLPAAWRKLPQVEKVADLIIVINRANVLGCDPLLLLQNMAIIAGQMCWKSTFLLQLLQANGWTAPQYHVTGAPNSADFWQKDDNGMAFSAVNPATGERETGSKITVKMVIGERWLDREGSKWRTMPEQMLKYRAVAFFCRTNAPAVLGGFYSQDELEDVVAQERRLSAQVAEPGPDVERQADAFYEHGGQP